MRFLVIVLALTGFIVSAGCTNTATGFGKDLEKSGQAIQKTVNKQSTESRNNAGSNGAYTNYNGASNAQQYGQPVPRSQEPQQLLPPENNTRGGYAATPSGY